MFYLTNAQYTNVCRVLKEISLGHLNYRLKYSDTNDDYDMLVFYTNLIGEMGQLHRSQMILQNINIVPPEEIEFYMTENFIIKSTSENLPHLIDKPLHEIENKPLGPLLTTDAQNTWSSIKRNFMYRETDNFSTTLFFKVNTWLRFTCFCYFWKLPDNSIHVSTYKNKKNTAESLIKQKNTDQVTLENHSFSPKADRNKNLMREIVQYFQEHLDGSLPDMTSITRHFGINEKKFKKSFKNFYNQTPYAYYIDKKLEKAMTLLKTSRMSIKEVAYEIGYNTKSGFYAAFKKKFGITPGDVVRDE